jgi:hypothetical protein
VISPDQEPAFYLTLDHHNGLGTITSTFIRIRRTFP